MSRPVRFGLIRRAGALHRWEADCISQLVSLPSVELATVILRTVPPDGRTATADSRLVRHARQGAWAPVDTAPPLPAVPERRCGAAPGPGGLELAPADVAAIEAERLDFLLALGSDRWSGPLLVAARWGVWAFRFAGQPGSPELPPGFWQVCRREPATGAALVALSDDPSGDPILREGFVATAGSYAANAATIALEAARWPAQLCAAAEAGAMAPRERRRLPRAEPGPPAGPGDLLRVSLGSARNRWRGFAERNLYADVWNVGLVRAPIERFLEPGYRPPVEWLPAPGPGTFRADPFGLDRDGRATVLYETFDYRHDIGRIAALELGPGDGPEIPVAIGPPLHLSYPYVFEVAGDILCIPETYQAREVALYRADEFPGRWSKVATLLRGVPALDATVFRHGERWWLTCTMQGPTERSHLHLYHAPDLLGPWTPHGANPVKVDIRSGRPAGTPFVHGGALYRPAQDASSTYGGRVVINRVRVLTPAEFEEEPAAAVGPFADSPYPDGLHTLAAVGGWTLLDAKRVVLMTDRAVRAGLRPWARQRVRHALALLRRGAGRDDPSAPSSPELS